MITVLPLMLPLAWAQIQVADLIYKHPGPNAVNRSLFNVLQERVSVRDFGAVGACVGISWAPPYPPSHCPDDTAAFNAAFAWAAEPFNHITVHVPPGYYRIDGTVVLGGTGVEMYLETGAFLRRISNLTNCTDPLVRLEGTNGVLRGGGTLTSDNPSPRGLVNVGPPCLTCYSNAEYNLVDGVRIVGAGASWRNFPPAAHAAPVDSRLNGSRGLCFDSSQTYMTGGSATYQNSARDVSVQDIDVGVYLGPDVNGNLVSNIQMAGIGQSGFLLEHNGENTISGGFVAGWGGNTTVITCKGCICVCPTPAFSPSLPLSSLCCALSPP